MASVFEKLVTESTAQGTLYDPGEVNPQQVGVLVSNIRGLGTERVVSDFSVAWLDFMQSIEPGQTLLWSDERYLVVKIIKGAHPSMGQPPIKVQLLHLYAACPHYRAGVLMTDIVRIVPEVSITLKSETEVPLDRIHIITPKGTPLRVNDQITWDGWVWFVRDVIPGVFDGNEYAVTADIIRLGYESAPQDYLFTNATVLRYRGDDSDPSPLTLRCRWYEPTHDRVTEDGQVVPAAVYFPQDADIITNDLVQVVSFDTADGSIEPLDDIVWWHVRLAAHEGEPLNIIRVELDGGSQNA
jgi:hypothetical protein